MQGKHLYVGNVGFHGRPPHGIPKDFTGFMFGPGGLRGVRGGVGVSSESVQRASAHGEHDTPVWKGARIVSVMNGTAVEVDDAALEQLSVVLGGLGADGGVLPIRYVNGDLELQGEGRVILQEFDQDRGGIPKATYSISLRMADPYWYGPADESVSQGDSVTYGNVAVASHRGNVAEYPRFTVIATSAIGAAGYQLKGKGRTFEVPGPLAVGQVDEVDYERETVRRDGVLVRGVTPRTFTLDGGPTGGPGVEWRFWPLSGAGRATMRPRSRYF